jgi:hypothetical protein
MKTIRINALVRPLTRGLTACVSGIQHLLMKAVLAASVQLCLFTARVLLDANKDQQASQSF